MTMVFLHPVGLDGMCWQFLTSERLASAVRYNMVWHGGRPEPDGPLRLETMADDVVAHNEGQLDLIGLSMGAAVSVYTALRHPDRVRSLMLCGGTQSDDPSGAQQRADLVLKEDMPGVLDWAIVRWFTKDAIETPDHPGIAYVKDRLLHDTKEQFAAGWLALGGNRSLDQMHTISVPTTVVHQLQDNGPLAKKREMADRIPGSRLVTVPGPHMCQLERPEEYQQAVLEHLEWVDRQLG